MPSRAAVALLLAVTVAASSPAARGAAPRRPPAPWTGRGVAGKLVVTSIKERGER